MKQFITTQQKLPNIDNSMNINFNLIYYEKHFKTFNAHNTVIIDS